MSDRLASVEGIEDKRRTGRATAPATAIAIAAAGVFGVLAALVAAKWGPLIRLDRRVDDGLNRAVSSHSGQLRFWRGVSAVLSPAVLRTAALVVGAWLLYRRQIRPALFAAGVSLGSLVLVTGVKDAVGRVRPVVPHPVAVAPGASFPSGHALTAAAVALAVAVVVWPRLRPRRRWSITVGAVLVAALVGLSRMMLGVHFLSDVVGGWLGATALVAALVAVLGIP